MFQGVRSQPDYGVHRLTASATSVGRRCMSGCRQINKNRRPVVACSSGRGTFMDTGGLMGSHRHQG